MSFKSIAGSSFVVHPVERHDFSAGQDDFLCSVCHRPRALHARYPFVPRRDRDYPPEEFSVRYRGPHPRFSRVGAANPEKVPVITASSVAYARRVRYAEESAMRRALSKFVHLPDQFSL
jgi:hypothetical protein